jgi:hypothetical protein
VSVRQVCWEKAHHAGDIAPVSTGSGGSVTLTSIGAAIRTDTIQHGNRTLRFTTATLHAT